MANWSEGYVADIGYTYGYYPELNPLRSKLPFLAAGLDFPEVQTACELGFGQGVGTAVHAAASTTQWYGTDFIPAQAAFAQGLCRAAGVKAELYDQSFAEFCSRTDLPDFDFIGLHGIWSWVSDANRSVILDFLRRKLKVGGVLYIGYNTPAGWATVAPVRQLMAEYSAVTSSPSQGTASRVDAALAFAQKLIATQPVYATSHPDIAASLKSLMTQDKRYVAHEYFNENWAPVTFSDMARQLEPAKLTYACSANYHDQVDNLSLTQEQRALLQEVDDPALGQTVRDFLMCQLHRRDYWVKGARPLRPSQRAALMHEARFVLCRAPADVPLTVTSRRGEADLQAEIYKPILDAMSRKGSVSLGELALELAPKGIHLPQLMQAMMVLGGMQAVAPAQDASTVDQARAAALRLNTHLCAQAVDSDDIQVLASPVTGGAVGISRPWQLFLKARLEGKASPNDWGQYAWDVSRAQGGKPPRHGAPAMPETLKDMVGQALAFAGNYLPILQKLGVTG